MVSSPNSALEGYEQRIGAWDDSCKKRETALVPDIKKMAPLPSYEELQRQAEQAQFMMQEMNRMIERINVKAEAHTQSGMVRDG